MDAGRHSQRMNNTDTMQWNAGGWFGSQIGATCWMLVAGVLTLFRDLATGLLVVGLFAAVNLLGWALWHRRRLSCYASTQVLIGLAGVAGLLSIFLLTRAGVWHDIQSGSQVSPFSTYVILALTFGGLMLMFYVRFGRGGSSAD